MEQDKRTDDTDKQKGLAPTIDLSKKSAGVKPSDKFKLLGKVKDKDKVSFFGGSNYYVQVGESFKNWLIRKNEI